MSRAEIFILTDVHTEKYTSLNNGNYEENQWVDKLRESKKEKEMECMNGVERVTVWCVFACRAFSQSKHRPDGFCYQFRYNQLISIEFHINHAFDHFRTMEWVCVSLKRNDDQLSIDDFHSFCVDSIIQNLHANIPNTQSTTQMDEQIDEIANPI